jgi:phage shock protein PspC (stress-responsive transcriptional regulator)
MTCARCQREIEVDSSFCRFCGAAASGSTATPSTSSLKRLPAEGKVAGVCAGIAAYLNTDVTLIRLAWVALSIVPGMLIGGLLAYAVAWLLLPEGQPGEVSPYAGRQLLRSTTNKTIGGVCGGLAEYFGVDSTIVRVLCAVLSIYPGAIIGGVLAYLIAWFIIPAPKLPHVVPATTA